MDKQIKAYTCPDNRKDWSISVGISEPVSITMTFVPDKLISDHASIKEYLKGCANAEWANPEEMLLSIIEDVNNEFVPKWLKVVYSHDNVEIKIEDQQPGLTNFKIPN